MTRSRFSRLAVLSMGLVLVAARAQAQPAPVSQTRVTPEVSFSIARVQKTVPAGTNPYNTATSFGVGVSARLTRRFAVEFEANRIGRVPLESLAFESEIGLARLESNSLRTLTNFRYLGHSGVTAMTILSGNLLYFFSSGRVQPFLAVGIGGAQISGIKTDAEVRSNAQGYYPEVVETRWQEDKIGVTYGGGLRVPLPAGFALRPEVRVYGTGAVVRGAMTIAYRW